MKKKNQKCIKGVRGVICDADTKDCDTCPFIKGIGIIPVLEKGCENE